jgi:hypothetical protein
VREASQQRRAGIAGIWEDGGLADCRAAARSAWPPLTSCWGGNCCPTSMWLPSGSAKTKPRTIVASRRPLTIRTPTVSIDNFARVVTIASAVCPCEQRVDTTARLCKMNLAIRARRRYCLVRRFLRIPVLMIYSLAPAHILLFSFPRPRLSGPWNACVPAREAYLGE